jgi:uncharacterized protein (TIGR03000 family)
MYSIILATMMTAGGAAPDFGHGCRGCYGCCGGCYGCCGGCYGCCGGCWGCCGGCYGCCGGCWGCWGGCYGGWSSCYGCCGGCYGWGACYGGCYGCYGVVAAPAVAVPVTPTLPAAPTKDEKKAASLGNSAAVVLKAPANVQLSVEGQNIPRTTSEETFRTPALEPGSSYTYTFKARVVRDGQTVAFTKQVKVRAGQTSEADFTKLTTEGKDVARVTVKLPAEARLYVDDVVCPLTSATRSFNTPELEAGRRYYYTLKAETTQEGANRTVTKRVVVEAGKQVTVEFSDLPVQAASR